MPIDRGGVKNKRTYLLHSQVLQLQLLGSNGRPGRGPLPLFLTSFATAFTLRLRAMASSVEGASSSSSSPSSLGSFGVGEALRAGEGRGRGERLRREAFLEVAVRRLLTPTRKGHSLESWRQASGYDRWWRRPLRSFWRSPVDVPHMSTARSAPTEHSSRAETPSHADIQSNAKTSPHARIEDLRAQYLASQQQLQTSHEHHKSIYGVTE